MKTTYNLICMSFDGEYVTEKRGFDTVSDAWEHAEDIGSRWFFYPFYFVTSASGKTIVDTPSGLEDMRRMRVKTIERMFCECSIFSPPETGVEEFIDILRLSLSIMLER